MTWSSISIRVVSIEPATFLAEIVIDIVLQEGRAPQPSIVDGHPEPFTAEALLQALLKEALRAGVILECVQQFLGSLVLERLDTELRGQGLLLELGDD